jgi:hypothetical protein
MFRCVFIELNVNEKAHHQFINALVQKREWRMERKKKDIYVQLVCTGLSIIVHIFYIEDIIPFPLPPRKERKRQNLLHFEPRSNFLILKRHGADGWMR